MHLEGLAGGGPKGAVAQTVGQPIEGEVERHRDAARRTAETQHHLPVLLLSLAAVIAIVLLITAVKLEDLDGALTEILQFIGKLAAQRFVQVSAARLELLELGRCCSLRCVGLRLRSLGLSFRSLGLSLRFVVLRLGWRRLGWPFGGSIGGGTGGNPRWGHS